MRDWGFGHSDGMILEDNADVRVGQCLSLEVVEGEHRLIQEHKRDPLLLLLLYCLHYPLNNAPVLLVTEVRLAS